MSSTPRFTRRAKIATIGGALALLTSCGIGTSMGTTETVVREKKVEVVKEVPGPATTVAATPESCLLALDLLDEQATTQAGLARANAEYREHLATMIEVYESGSIDDAEALAAEMEDTNSLADGQASLLADVDTTALADHAANCRDSA